RPVTVDTNWKPWLPWSTPRVDYPKRRDGARLFRAGQCGADRGRGIAPGVYQSDATFRTGPQTIVRAGQRSETIRSDVDAEGVATALVGLIRGVGSQFLVNPAAIDLG